MLSRVTYLILLQYNRGNKINSDFFFKHNENSTIFLKFYFTPSPGYQAPQPIRNVNNILKNVPMVFTDLVLQIPKVWYAASQVSDPIAKGHFLQGTRYSDQPIRLVKSKSLPLIMFVKSWILICCRPDFNTDYCGND